MCSEPTSLAVFMAKADKYATADSAMRVKVTASDKQVGSQHEGRDVGSSNRPSEKRSNRNNANWMPKQSFEQLLDAPCKIHSGAQPSIHTLRHCSFPRRLSQGDGLSAPPRAQAAPCAPAPGPGPAPPPPPHDEGHLHNDYPHQDGAFVVFTSEGDDKHSLR
ncbi:hypothetical protein D1007_19240 [Hordeum vulgare]|nr:hypothetical protein D1007_19240 [Hordeum vulgare]